LQLAVLPFAHCADTSFVMYCIVVRRGEFQVYDKLHQTFGQRIPVVWDRRGRAKLTDRDRERPERRGDPPTSWTALGFVVVDRPDC
jgi:hypothetical protein